MGLCNFHRTKPSAFVILKLNQISLEDHDCYVLKVKHSAILEHAKNIRVFVP